MSTADLPFTGNHLSAQRRFPGAVVISPIRAGRIGLPLWFFSLALLLTALAPPSASAAAPVVSNVRSAQRPGTKLVDLTYDVTADAGVGLYVTVLVSSNAGASYTVPGSSFTGSGFGTSVMPGRNKTITWDAGRDWPNHFSANVRFRVTATDNGAPPSGGPPGMVWIPGGTFVMGSPSSEVERFSDEVQHTVTVSGFYMSRYLLTQGEYLAVVGSNPSYFTTQDCLGNPINPDLNRPVETVSWYDATNYCYRLNVGEGRLGSGWVYRLPTESEWEYACRAGTTTPFHYGPNLLSGMANFNGQYEYIGGVGTHNNPNGIYLGRTTAVGSYAPNGFGLYDMHGNVWEWCLDWHGTYPTGSVVNPRGPGAGPYRVFRGGNWGYNARTCRSARRDGGNPSYRNSNIGFRPVLAPGQ